MMSLERWFMMTMAMGLGLLAVVAAIHNHEIYYRLPKARLIEDLGGRNAVRIAYGVLGLTFIGLGVAIAWGRR
jgi:hypothetical protein